MNFHGLVRSGGSELLTATTASDASEAPKASGAFNNSGAFSKLALYGRCTGGHDTGSDISRSKRGCQLLRFSTYRAFHRVDSSDGSYLSGVCVCVCVSMKPNQ